MDRRSWCRSRLFWLGALVLLCLTSSWIQSVVVPYRIAIGHNPYLGVDAWDGQLRLTLRYDPDQVFDPNLPPTFHSGPPPQKMRWFSEMFFLHPDREYS